MVKLMINKEHNTRYIVDDEKQVVLYTGERRSLEDYKDECLHGNNECAYLIEKVTITKTGKDAIVWGDYETGETFISY